MASTAAHHSTGWAVGLISAAVVSRHGADPYHVWMAATVLAARAGATAPDWLELAWWSSRKNRLWITHRSWTHWGLAWIGLLLYCHANLDKYGIASPVFGFAAGGVVHLLADWPNPLGVPWLLTKRYSLHWWKSGRCDLVIIAAVWMVAVTIADQVWWHGQVRRQGMASIAKIGAAYQPHTLTIAAKAATASTAPTTRLRGCMPSRAQAQVAGVRRTGPVRIEAC